MQFTPLDIADVFLVTPRRFEDARGWFMESWRHEQFSKAIGKEINFVQDNHSYSAEVGTVRGLHYQSPPHAQGKLVRCTRGAVMDVAVDFRRSSPSYGQWVGERLTEESGKMLWVPAGFLHGFATLAPGSEVQYKCTDVYAADCDANVAWDDADLAIDWGISHGFNPNQAVISDKDAAAPAFNTVKSPFKY